MNNLQLRIIAGTIGAAALIGAVVYGPETLFFVIGILCILGLNEFYTLFSKSKQSPQLWFGIILSALLYMSVTLWSVGFKEFFHHAVMALPPLVGLSLLGELFRGKYAPFQNIGLTWLGMAYVLVPFCLFIQIGFCFDGNYHWQIPMGFFIALWCSDTGAYAFGKTMGKTKLFERISPNKTWEGSIGGLLTSVGGTLLFGYLTGVLPMWQWAVLAVLVVVFGSLGDLVESMLKRSLHVKDSGTLIPGHGGVLDRFDGLLVAAPFVWFFLAAVNQH